MDPYKQLFDALFQSKFAIKIQALKDLKIIAEREPEVIVPYFPQLFTEVKEGPEKLKWGVMMLISMCAHLDKEAIFEHLGLFAAIADGPSVIARDAYVRMLAMLSQEQQYTDTTTALLLDEVLKSPVNQLPSYAETATKHIPVTHYAQLAGIISMRLPDVEDYPPKEKKLQRYLKLLKKG
jgi:hypothetical protein